MLYKFQSKAGGDVIMTAPHGDQVLRLMGREPAPQGILLAAQLPAALAALEAALADAAGVREDAAGRPVVSIRQRAWPLVQLMRRAHAQTHDIVWGA